MGLEHSKKELYDLVKRKFLDGELVPDITRDLEIDEPTTMLNIVQKLGKDFDVERAVRMDVFLMGVLRHANDSLTAARNEPDRAERERYFSHAEKAFALFDRASENNRKFRDWKASRRRGKGKTRPRAAEAEQQAPASTDESEPSFEELL